MTTPKQAVWVDDLMDMGSSMEISNKYLEKVAFIPLAAKDIDEVAEKVKVGRIYLYGHNEDEWLADEYNKIPEDAPWSTEVSLAYNSALETLAAALKKRIGGEK